MENNVSRDVYAIDFSFNVISLTPSIAQLKPTQDKPMV